MEENVPPHLISPVRNRMRPITLPTGTDSVPPPSPVGLHPISLCVLHRPALLCAVLRKEIDPFQFRPRLSDGSGFQLERHCVQSDYAFLCLRLF